MHVGLKYILFRSMNMKHSYRAVYTDLFYLISWFYRLLVKLFTFQI